MGTLGGACMLEIISHAGTQHCDPFWINAANNTHCKIAYTVQCRYSLTDH